MGLINIRYVGKLQKPQRIEALTDGTLAIVMTILVLELTLGAGDTLAEKLAHMGPEIFQYFMTFISIGGAWMMHYYQFYYIRRVDSIAMWLNILFLATVALIPFSYGLMLTNYGENTADQHTAMLFFAGNLLVMTLLLLIHWLYATYKHHLVDKDILHEKVSIMRNILLFGTIYPLIVIGLSFVQFGVSQTLFGILSLLYLALVILLGLHFGKVKEKEAT